MLSCCSEIREKIALEELRCQNKIKFKKNHCCFLVDGAFWKRFYYFSSHIQINTVQGIWPFWILFAVFPYTSNRSLGLRRVFITIECLMSALKSLLSGLEFLVAVLWKDLHVEKGPVEHYLGPDSSSCILYLLFVRAFLSYWLAAYLADLKLIILSDLLCFQLTPGRGVQCTESELWGQDSQRRSLTQLALGSSRTLGQLLRGDTVKAKPKVIQMFSPTVLLLRWGPRGEEGTSCRHLCRRVALTAFTRDGSWCLNLGFPSHLPLISMQLVSAVGDGVFWML